MQRASELPTSTRRKILLAGPPKGGGKTTFAATAPQPVLFLSYDLGNLSLPPGVDPAGVWWQPYPPARGKLSSESTAWKRPKNVGAGKRVL